MSTLYRKLLTVNGFQRTCVCFSKSTLDRECGKGWIDSL